LADSKLTAAENSYKETEIKTESKLTEAFRILGGCDILERNAERVVVLWSVGGFEAHGGRE